MRSMVSFSRIAAGAVDKTAADDARGPDEPANGLGRDEFDG